MEESGEEDGTFETRMAFVRTLSALKREGSALLVVGNVPDEVHTTACRRMLGDSPKPRRRLFVETDAICADAVDRLPAHGAHPPAETARRITNPSYARSASAAAGEASEPPIPETTVESRTLSDLGASIAREIEALEEASGGFDPAEFRLCFDSLAPLVDEHDDELVFRFLHALSGLVREVDGQAHVHLPLDPESPLVRTIEPLFDAVVELGIECGRPRQRWHLRDAGLSSEWLPL